MAVRNYFRQRLESIKHEDRSTLAQREIQTLKNLLRIAAKDVTYVFGSELAASNEPNLIRISNILDLGSGDKFLEAPFSSLGCSYMGLDINDLDFEHEKLKLQDDSIDCVVALGLIEHLSDPTSLMDEIFRVLRPGGLMFLSTPNFRHCYRRFYDDPTHIRPYTNVSISFLARSFGFTNVRCFPNLRAKPAWCYLGPLKFWRARWFFPVRNDSKIPLPAFLKGSAVGIFMICQKPS